MKYTSFQFPVMPALLIRHVEDSAFYWSQLDLLKISPQVGFDKLCHFNRLLEAHLDGLAAAREHAWAPALKSLQRWQKSADAFVCTSLALQYNKQERLSDVVSILCRRPDELLRGTISALAYFPREATAVISQWSEPEAHDVVQVAALRATALLGPGSFGALSKPLNSYFLSTSPYIRAAACRVGAQCNQPEVESFLQGALTDIDMPVRAEAAIALAKGGNAKDAQTVLLDCILAQTAICATATGWYCGQAARRLRRWVMELAWLTSPNDPVAQQIIASLSVRDALTFVLCHGDLFHLPFVVEQLANPSLSRYAGWIWQSLTGINLASNSLTLAEPDPSTFDGDQLIMQTQVDTDNGLPQPDQAAISAYSALHSPTKFYKTRVLMGRELHIQHALSVLESGAQAYRVLAARAANQFQSEVQVNVRAKAPVQHHAIKLLRGLITDKANA